MFLSRRIIMVTPPSIMSHNIIFNLTDF